MSRTRWGAPTVNTNAIVGTALAAALALTLPALGAVGHSAEPAHVDRASQVDTALVSPVATALETAELDTSACATAPVGVTAGAPGVTTGAGVGGTTTDDLEQFALAYNAVRIEHCLDPIPVGNFVYDACMESRLFWMAEDPSTDPTSAWGHIGSVRSDGLPSVGCDGNLAGGTDNTAQTVAVKWWDSLPHRASLYRPGSGIDGACIAFAMSHGGVPNEPYGFVRATARWVECSEVMPPSEPTVVVAALQRG